MPGLNSRGTPYPLDSDPIADWPQILTDLAGTLGAMIRGTITLSDGGSEPATKVVTFPSGFFPNPPGVFLTHGTGAGESTVSNLAAHSISNTQCSITLSRNTTTTVTVHWLAVG